MFQTRISKRTGKRGCYGYQEKRVYDGFRREDSGDAARACFGIFRRGDHKVDVSGERSKDGLDCIEEDRVCKARVLRSVGRGCYALLENSPRQTGSPVSIRLSEILEYASQACIDTPYAYHQCHETRLLLLNGVSRVYRRCVLDPLLHGLDYAVQGMGLSISLFKRL